MLGLDNHLPWHFCLTKHNSLHTVHTYTLYTLYTGHRTYCSHILLSFTLTTIIHSKHFFMIVYISEPCHTHIAETGAPLSHLPWLLFQPDLDNSAGTLSPSFPPPSCSSISSRLLARHSTTFRTSSCTPSIRGVQNISTMDSHLAMWVFPLYITIIEKGYKYVVVCLQYELCRL